MSRINTNVTSLIGRNNLQKANSSLTESLTRLSTGLRINTGKDDPAGLIASENLRSDITSIKRAISNTDRANQVIATADSALGQVSSLLNDIRGLVTESANNGALSQEQIDANQLQVDSSLEALNRIAQTTTFQGRRLLDGSLDFLSNSGANPTAISNVQIDQANLGATGQVAVDVNVTAAATQASVAIGELPDVTPTTTTALEFDVQTSAAGGSTGSVDFDIVTTDSVQAIGTLDFTAQGAGTALANGDSLTITTPGNETLTLNIVDSTLGGTATATFDGTSTIAVELDGETIDSQALAALIQTELQSGGNAIDAGVTVTATDGGDGFDTVAAEAGVDLTTAGSDTLTVTALNDSIADGLDGNDIDVAFVDNATTANGVDSVTFDGSTITINADFTGGVGSDDVATAIAAYQDVDGNAAFSSASSGTANVATANAGTTVADVVGNGTVGVDEITTTETIDITGIDGEASNINISFADSALGALGDTTKVIGNETSGYTVQINSDTVGGVAIDDIRAAIEGIAQVDTAAFNVSGPGTSTYNSIAVGGATTFPDAPPATEALINGVDAVTSTQSIDITTAVGFAGNFDISINADDDTSGGTFLSGDATSGYTLNIDDNTGTTVEAIRAAVESIDEVGVATLGQNTTGTLEFNPSNGDTVPATLNIIGAGLGSETTGVDADVVFEIAGQNGSEVLSFEAGTTLPQLLAGINAISDATGVTASADEAGTGIVLSSSGYGDDAFVDIQIIDEGSGATPSGAFTDAVSEGTRSTGVDIVATVNGISATGNGNDLSINTATLDLSATLTAGFEGSSTFTITGGGAKFQLGPDVVSNQQARLGIGSVNTAALGGNDGLLYQLGTGGDSDLSSDPSTAAKIVESAIDQVTSLRGRLGAFQRTSLETNRNALNDTLVNLTEAESAIRDADFASETANLTRSQILVQSGTRVLAIANQNPQNVLSLLG